jgi:hypothetical protein
MRTVVRPEFVVLLKVKALRVTPASLAPRPCLHGRNLANMALQLAQTRYQLGLSSIVELSQAQSQKTDAAIGNTDAQC